MNDEKNDKVTNDIIKNVYDDGMKPTIEESGKTLSLIPKAINAALLPLRKWILEREYSLKETEKLLENKLKNVDIKDIVEPEAYIAIPTLQAISYSMNNDILRNMYANLLAKSMNVNINDRVHPSFVEIIKQMSPNDAKIYKDIFDAQIRPVLDLSISFNNQIGQNEYLYNVSWITSYEYKIISVCISNLIRMGLIEIDSGASYTNDNNYNIVRNTPIYKNYKKKIWTFSRYKN